MEELKNENKRKGFIGSMLIHLLLVLIFIITALTTPLPLPEEEGMIIDFGQADEGIGEIDPSSKLTESIIPIEPNEPVVNETKVEPAEPDPVVVEKVITQNVEEAPAVKTNPQKEIPVETKPVEKPKEEVKELPKEEPKREVDTKALFKSKKDQNTSTGEGNKQGNKDQGLPTGNIDGSHEGQENAKGNQGISFDLSGRSISVFPDINIPYLIRKEKVVVDVTVDRNGNVIKATPGARGSTTTDQNLWNKAKSASEKTKFTPNADAPETQKGSITFVFIPK